MNNEKDQDTYNPDGRYEIIVFGAIKNGPERGLIPNSDARTDNLDDAIARFNTFQDTTYGADLFDHQRGEAIASQMTPARREFERTAHLGPDENDYTTPEFQEWGRRYQAERTEDGPPTAQEAASNLLREAEKTVEALRGTSYFPQGLESAIHDAHTAGISPAAEQTTEAAKAPEAKREFSAFRSTPSPGRDRSR